MLSINHIVKQYAGHRALDDVSFEVPEGSLFGLLGPNGAGKTSLIRIINQILAPDQGEILLNGERLNPSHISRIGYLPEERGLYKKMRIGEQILYLAQLKGLSRQEATVKIRYWFEKLEMTTWWDKKVEDLSKGMQQKVQFVATVIHQPKLIILDEPFSGFDPVNADIIKNEIIELNRSGITILFSTHRMESVEQLCDSIVLLNKSKKVLDGGVKEIKKQFYEDRYEIRIGAVSEAGDEYVGEYPGFLIESADRRDEELLFKIQLKEQVSLNDVLPYFMEKGILSEVRPLIPTIHDIFVKQVTQFS